MREIAETRAAGRDAEFDALIERITSSGGEIIEDETVPLYTEVGMDEFEVGEERIVEFNLNGMDIKLFRKKETHSLQGSGHQKHLEELDIPRVTINMKRKPETATEWQTVDLEDMF